MTDRAEWACTYTGIGSCLGAIAAFIVGAIRTSVLIMLIGLGLSVASCVLVFIAALHATRIS